MNLSKNNLQPQLPQLKQFIVLRPRCEKNWPMNLVWCLFVFFLQSQVDFASLFFPVLLFDIDMNWIWYYFLWLSFLFCFQCEQEMRSLATESMKIKLRQVSAHPKTTAPPSTLLILLQRFSRQAAALILQITVAPEPPSSSAFHWLVLWSDLPSIATKGKWGKKRWKKRWTPCQRSDVTVLPILQESAKEEEELSDTDRRRTRRPVEAAGSRREGLKSCNWHWGQTGKALFSILRMWNCFVNKPLRVKPSFIPADVGRIFFMCGKEMHVCVLKNTLKNAMNQPY